MPEEQGHWAFWPPDPISWWQAAAAAAAAGKGGCCVSALGQVCACSWRKPRAPGPGATLGSRLASTEMERAEPLQVRHSQPLPGWLWCASGPQPEETKLLVQLPGAFRQALSGSLVSLSHLDTGGERKEEQQTKRDRWGWRLGGGRDR